MKKSLYFALILIFISLGMASCSPIARPEQLSHEKMISLTNGNSMGQTFFARFRGLSGIEFYINVDESTKSDLTLSLLNGTQDDTVLAEARLPVAEVTHPDFYRFEFPAQVDSTNHDYYVRMSLSGEGRVEIGVGSGEAYLDGALYQNDIPQDNQLAFRLVYDPYQIFVGLVLMAFSWLGIIAIAGFLYILPGWAVLGWLEPNWAKRSWAEKLGLGAGMSLSIYPILFLWTHLIGLNLGPMYAWLPPLLGLGSIVWRNRRWLLSLGMRENFTLRSVRPAAIRPADWFYLFVLALIFATRFWVIRNLSIPLWGDSYQHTMIAQLLVDNNGLFNSWEPYADLQTFTYHFGFHSLVAIFHWLTNLSLPQAVLWTGQIVNGLSVTTLYPLALKASGNRWASISAVLLAGLLFPMPMYYVNWGRYTQLAGQVILPILIFALWMILEKEQIDWKIIILNSVLLAGLALTHYLVLTFAGLFLLAFVILHLFREKERSGVLLRTSLIIFSGSLLIFLPWIPNLLDGRLINNLFTQLLTPTGPTPSSVQEFNSLGDLSIYLPRIIWISLPLIIARCLWNRERYCALVSLWWFILILAANPQWLNLPGSGIISNFTVFISAYIPASILTGSLVGRLLNHPEIGLEKIAHYKPDEDWPVSAFKWILYSIVILACFLGARLRLQDLQRNEHSLVTQPDIKATNWIQKNTPKEARFLINSLFAFGNNVIVGSDAGWWLPLLANRQTTTPPINYGLEEDPWPGYAQEVNSLTSKIEDLGIDDPDVLKSLRKHNIKFIYIGQRHGSVNSGRFPLLDPKNLLASNNYVPIYHEDRVWIFRIQQ